MTAASRPDRIGDRTVAAGSSRVPAAPVVGLVVVGLAVFLAITATAGLLIWDDAPADSRDGGPRSLGSVDSAATVAVPSAQLEQNTRIARIGSASLVLPDDPYRVHPEPLVRDDFLDSFFWAAATVHAGYDNRRDWSSAMLLGRLSAGSFTGDLEHDGPRVIEKMSVSFFDGHATEVRQISSADHAVDGHPGMLFTATVHYSVPGLPSRYDTVSALLVRLDDGSVVLAATSVPDDSDPALAQQAVDALQSLSIR